MHDLRGRLDAIFWAVTHNGYWHDLPPEFGPYDTAHRQFRRWAHKGVWTRLLTDAATTQNPVLKRLTHWLCRALRRALRILGVAAIAPARRLGLASALPGPYWMCPDPDLSAALWPFIRDSMREWRESRNWQDRTVLQGAIAYHKLVGGRRWIPSWLAPP